ncbi:MAG: hypothetical protein EA365_12410 [Gloeocapsa sp. DLM2.Bin57]|nr:MAG: hypothetical protein EA365_12410 [Gloeocapsa sp. DLM2.Bin57]
MITQVTLTDFIQVTSDLEATTSRGSIVYNRNNSKFFYNPNGSQANFASTIDRGGHFATLTGNLSNDNIFLA